MLVVYSLYVTSLNLATPSRATTAGNGPIFAIETGAMNIGIDTLDALLVVRTTCSALLYLPLLKIYHQHNFLSMLQRACQNEPCYVLKRDGNWKLVKYYDLNASHFGLHVMKHHNNVYQKIKKLKLPNISTIGLTPEYNLFRKNLMNKTDNLTVVQQQCEFALLEEQGEESLDKMQFTGPFPAAILEIPNLLYLDLRFNSFSGQIPQDFFSKNLDAIFLNNNQFDGKIPQTLEKHTVRSPFCEIGEEERGILLQKGWEK
ncbi:hypothetical protein LXL04_027103 [Taraxacum kok-saghyz]